MERKQITRFVLTALFAALIAAGAFIKIPLAPAPVTLQTLFALLAATILPPAMVLLSVISYLLLGAIGLPIFTTGGGLAAMLGPTGGFLIGMIPGVLAGSLIMKAMENRVRLASIISAIATTALIYLVGLPWMSVQLNLSFTATLAAGLLPFIVGDTLKIIITVIVTPQVRARVKEILEK